MSNINWVGKKSDECRVGRGSAGVPACETRWIVPVKPYESPKGSWERMQNNVLIGAGIAIAVFSYAILIIAELGAL